jgi:hypothetical protein
MNNVSNIEDHFPGPTPEEEKLPLDTQSWAAEVQADSSGKWTGNMVRFATKLEAEKYAGDLSMRWTAVREWRVVTSPDPVNYRIVDNRLEAL